MTYIKQTWADGPAGTTAMSAARLNYMETGIEAANTPAGSGLGATVKRVITGNYTLVLDDSNNMILHSTAATAVTITVPNQTSVNMPLEVPIPWRQYGSGQITWAAAAGVTLISRGNMWFSAGLGSEGTVTQVDSNVWVISGDLTA